MGVVVAAERVERMMVVGRHGWDRTTALSRASSPRVSGLLEPLPVGP